MIDMQKLKDDIKSSAANKDKIIFFKEGTKYRIRFLVDFMKGYEIKWHSRYGRENGVNCPCQEEYGRECIYCDDESVSSKSRYCWPVFEYESGEVKLLLFAANRCSPVPALMEFYSAYKTICDRDYEIKQIGSGTSKTFSVVPLEKNRFKNDKVKPLSESAVLKYVDKAFPVKDGFGESESGRRKNEEDFMNIPEEETDDWGNEDEEDEDYESMKPQELYKLCKERDIKCKPKKMKQYYIDLLTQYDKENEEDDDWGNEDEEEELPFT